MICDVSVRHAVYQYFAMTGSAPTADVIANAVGSRPDAVIESFERLQAQRVLKIAEDGRSILMAHPFSAVRTQHIAVADGKRYYANCAWDALGVIAALRRPGMILSRCEQTKDPLYMRVGVDGPETSSWVFHCLVPAARWWDDIVFT